MSTVSVATASSPATYQPLAADKAQIDIDYARRPHGGSKTIWIVAGLAILLVILFIIAVVAFFFLSNSPSTHDITVSNDTNTAVVVNVGAAGGNDFVFLSPVTLNPGESKLYKATPGTSLVVTGLYPTQSSVNDLTESAHTTVELSLAGVDYEGPVQISEGNVILGNLTKNTESVDRYGVSVQEGYNIPMTITPGTAVNPQNKFQCGSPQWAHTIDATGPNMCPVDLQDTVNGQYQGCQVPCNVFTGMTGTVYCCEIPGNCDTPGGCENNWPNYDYYTIFQEACPNCLITNCDTANYFCGGQDALTSYRIHFVNQ